VIEAPSITVEALTAGDWPAVSAIYADGIATRNATFETEMPSWEAWDAAHLADHRLVARDSGSEPQTLGWAALTAYSDRCAYAGVAEVSVYVAKEARGRGVGRTLLAALVESADDAGIWTLQAGVFPENLASLSLHHSCGFRVVGLRERIGQLDGQWRDVVLLERRSKEIGG
jgi:L-amino acid N-acyltransferase YncA